ncbi:MAG: exo-beta-N-acetylmuramidase NamZ family protein [Lewinella sp.]|uniref:exo-beta-N-acetylmuramidase NamZ family protein n=1 Tax=Lewinella sp. TaxID=2004506 RepID=UPI003D6C4F51
MKELVHNGIDHLLSANFPLVKSSRWGLVTNDAALTLEGEPTRTALLNQQYNLQCLYSPEHGLSARGADGEAQHHQLDHLTGLKVYSLYGPGFGPELEEVDAVFFDLPDIGVRFYTYIWTLSHLMEACCAQDKKLVVLDRINPLSGQLALAEGPLLDEEALSSFIGRWSMPIRHSLTVGELARYWQASRNMQNLDLEIVPCKGWQRDFFFSDTQMPFVAPSPAINSPKTLLTYPALCFMEGLNVNDGRGTPSPFQQFGAPWLDATSLVGYLQELAFPGLVFEPVFYTPVGGRYQGESCQGALLRVTEPQVYRPVATGLAIIATLWRFYAHHLSEATYPTHANPSGTGHLALLLGDQATVHLLQEHPKSSLLSLKEWTNPRDWREEVTPFLQY